MKVCCLALPALLTAALFVGACNKEAKTTPTPAKSAASMGFMNTKCPISGEELGEDGWDKVTEVTYKGQKYGVCCPNCAPKFNALSDADKAAKLAKAK